LVYFRLDQFNAASRVMRDKTERLPAAAGSMTAVVLADLRIVQSFMTARDQALQGLLGRRSYRNHVREEIIRSVVIEFGSDRVQGISFYQRELANYGSSNAIRDEIRKLVTLGVLFVAPNPADKRATQVFPTRKLVNWYLTVMPRISDEINAIIDRRGKL
jgi:hypothetical protein